MPSSRTFYRACKYRGCILIFSVSGMLLGQFKHSDVEPRLPGFLVVLGFHWLSSTVIISLTKWGLHSAVKTKGCYSNANSWVGVCRREVSHMHFHDSRWPPRMTGQDASGEILACTVLLRCWSPISQYNFSKDHLVAIPITELSMLTPSCCFHY